MREREDTNRTRVAGSRDGVEGVVTITLNTFRNGAVGFIDWLDLIDDSVRSTKDLSNLRIVEKKLYLLKSYA